MDIRKEVRKAKANLLLELERSGVPLSSEDEQIVRGVGMGAALESSAPIPALPSHGDDRYHLTLEEYGKRIPRSWREKWVEKDILRSDWAPKSVTEIDEGMYSFIDSHMPRFCDLKEYLPFYLYLEQARRWMEDTTKITDLASVDEIEAFKDREIERIDQNLLYGMDRYIYRQEAETPGGRLPYIASTPQALSLFIIDCGYSALIGKLRQGAWTTTIGAAALLRALTKTSLSVVIAADDKESTGKNIFSTKIKYPLGQMPPWIQPDSVPNFSESQLTFDFAPGAKKSDRKQFTSTFTLMASAETTAINGMTPSILLLDESADMPTFNKLVLEVEPTMIGLDENPASPTYGTLIRKRQIVAWSTGTSNSRGKGQFEGAYKSLISRWKRRENTRGYIPLFFDWTCRRGANKQWYLDLRQQYLSGSIADTQGMSSEDALAMFGAHYPSSPDDMFMVSHKTIVPVETIDRNMELCLTMPQADRPVRGRFVPQWDTTVMPEGSPIPHRPIGVTFVPDPYDSPDSPVELYAWPENHFKNRYFQGTDPVNADDGLSMHASAVYDCMGQMRDNEMRPTIACIVNGRTSPLDEIYLQTKLMGMFYRNWNQQACKEVIEANQGHKYTAFVVQWLKMENTLVRQKELHQDYWGGSHQFGADLKSTRKSVLLRDAVDLTARAGPNIKHYVYWAQLRTIRVDRGNNDQPEWGTIDTRRYNDDVVIACTWAFVCYRSFSHMQLENMQGEESKYRMRAVWVEGRDGQIRREYKREKIVRYA